MITMPPLRIKWGDFPKAFPLQRIKVPEKGVRECILDWLIWHSHCMAWWNEPHGAIIFRGKRIRSAQLLDKHNRKGVSDILGSWKGKPLAIEVKRPGTKLHGAGIASLDQIAFIEEAREKGWIAFFAFNIDHVKMQLKEFEEYYRMAA